MPVLSAGWLTWLENTPWSVSIRQSLYLYPVIEIVHIFGIVMVAGGAIYFDLRLLGISGKMPLKDMAGHLLPWSRRGLILAVPSGVLLFITNAVALGNDPTFHIKLLLLLMAGVNAWIFHAYVLNGKSGESREERHPGKANAVCSIILWLSIIACGRLLAY